MNSPEKEKREQEIYESFFAEPVHLKSLRPQPKEQDVEKYPEDKSFEDEWKDYYNNSLVSRLPISKREVAKHFYWFAKKNAWKPSEEQMEALEDSIRFNKTNINVTDIYPKEQPDFPTTDEQVKEFLATHPKIKVPKKYKNPDWLFKKLEQPEVDLEEKFNDFLDNVEGVPRMWHSDEQIEWGKDIARHFYELGLNARKEDDK